MKTQKHRGRRRRGQCKFVCKFVSAASAAVAETTQKQNTSQPNVNSNFLESWTETNAAAAASGRARARFQSNISRRRPSPMIVGAGLMAVLSASSSASFASASEFGRPDPPTSNANDAHPTEESNSDMKSDTMEAPAATPTVPHPNDDAHSSIANGRRKKQLTKKAKQQQQEQQEGQQEELDKEKVEHKKDNSIISRVKNDGSDEQFETWCRRVMGIQMPNVKIKTFQYPDYMAERRLANAHRERNADVRAAQAVLEGIGSIDPSSSASVDVMPTVPTVPVRGLAAKQQIHKGDNIITIPLNAMISVRTTIDHDPVLSTVLGPAQRATYGWDGDNAPFYELPLLVVAALYHIFVLDGDSPLARYVEVLLHAPVDSMPILMNDNELSQQGKTFPTGVQKVVADIREDVRDMYVTVIGALVKDFPEVFGPPKGDDRANWAFSFEKFRWAFAIVNSRHWNVPVQDLDDAKDGEVSGSTGMHKTVSQSTLNAPAITPTDQTFSEDVDLPPHDSEAHHLSSVSVDGIENPPAAQPTDSFVEQQVTGSTPTENVNSRESNELSEDTGEITADSDEYIKTPKQFPSHSFLAPLADLLNFGPPCARGSYDSQTHTFNVVATCDLQAGQEITFYYSSDCEDVIYANYGFTHPMIPLCPTSDDLQKQIHGWKSRSEELATALTTAYNDMDSLEADIGDLTSRLDSCGCQEEVAPQTDDYVPRVAEATQPPAATASLGDEEPSQPPPRRTVTAGAPHKELRGSAHSSRADEETGSNESTEEHGGVRRLWRKYIDGRDVRDSL